MTDPRPMSDLIDQAVADLGIDPRIMAAAEREARGQRVNWDEVFAEIETPAQMELGMVSI